MQGGREGRGENKERKNGWKRVGGREEVEGQGGAPLPALGHGCGGWQQAAQQVLAAPACPTAAAATLTIWSLITLPSSSTVRIFCMGQRISRSATRQSTAAQRPVDGRR